MKRRRRTPFKGIIVAGRPVTTEDGRAAGINKGSPPENDNVITTHDLEEIDRAEEEMIEIPEGSQSPVFAIDLAMIPNDMSPEEFIKIWRNESGKIIYSKPGVVQEIKKMKYYTIAKKVDQTYGHGDSGHEFHICPINAYQTGSVVFPPIFPSIEKARKYLNGLEWNHNMIIVELNVDNSE